MVTSFADRDTERFYHTGRRPKWLPPTLSQPALRKLDMLNAARNLKDLRSPPGNRLELLRGKWRGYHSIRINEQLRVVFRWHEGNAEEVQIVDYHK